MKLMFPRIALSLVPLFAMSCVTAEKPAEPVAEAARPAPVEKILPNTLPEAVGSEFRTPNNVARDAYRHPLETLQFFGLAPNMRVMEISPGSGWYSEILAPFLTRHGEFIAVLPPSGDSEYFKATEGKYKGWIAATPEIKASIVTLEPSAMLALDPVDLVLTFRNVHNWMNAGEAQKYFDTFFKVLKPGGVLGVVEHRENAKKKQDPKAKSGYVKESEVIRLAVKAGFKLDQKSEINANPKDTKDYPAGVWTLPPSLAKGEENKATYVGIGESDRMTLRFVKPEPKVKNKPKFK